MQSLLLTLQQNPILIPLPTDCVKCTSNAIQVPVKPLGWGQQVQEFVSKLLDTADFPARWHCGNWTDFHGMLYIASDLLIFLAYFAIPILLYRLLRRRKDIPFLRIFLFFIGFILLCGLTHFIDALIFWWPAYRLSAVLRLATALISISTVYQLYRIFPDIVQLRSISDLEREIEKRKMSEQQLAANEFLLAEAGRIAGVGGWEIDLDNDKRVWSKTVYDILEVPENYDINSRKLGSYYPEPYKSMLAEAVEQAITRGIKWDMEVQAITFTGKTIWLRHTGEAVYDGKATKIRGITMKIDQYKNNELELLSALHTSTEKQRQLENFSYMLSHNIRNHTSNLAALTDMIDPETFDRENQELFAKTRTVVADLTNTLNDVTAIIQARVFPVKKEVLHIHEEIEAVLHTLNDKLQQQGIKVTKAITELQINFSKSYFHTILNQLFVNAIRYRDPERRLELDISSYTNDTEVVIELRDNGLGIDLEKHGARLFQLYSTCHHYPGAKGVGLYLVKTQLESLGARITVESAVGRGTTFKIFFPAVPITQNMS